MTLKIWQKIYFEAFETWADVIKYVSNDKELCYHAPMDRLPVKVVVVKRFKNGKLRIKSDMGSHSFTIDSGHLSRLCFRKTIVAD